MRALTCSGVSAAAASGLRSWAGVEESRSSARAVESCVRPWHGRGRPAAEGRSVRPTGAAEGGACSAIISATDRSPSFAVPRADRTLVSPAGLGLRREREGPPRVARHASSGTNVRLECSGLDVASTTKHHGAASGRPCERSIRPGPLVPSRFSRGRPTLLRSRVPLLCSGEARRFKRRSTSR
jgi:hypothetical protein